MQYVRSDYSLAPSEVTERDTDSVTSLADETSAFKWVNIIFLPYQTWWQWLILGMVSLKLFFCPLNTINQRGIQCNPDFYSDFLVLHWLHWTYKHFSTPLYMVDTFLYIVHRQVSDEAMKREYARKPGIFLFLDLAAMIPLHTFAIDNPCSEIRLWPHILFYNELLLTYRIWTFFGLTESHKFPQLFVGYMILLMVTVNALTCCLIMFTHQGLCDACRTNFKLKSGVIILYDWRSFVVGKLLKGNFSATVHYIYGGGLIMYQIFHKVLEPIKPITYIEMYLCIWLMWFGYLIQLFIIRPKFFGEGLLRNKAIVRFHPRVLRIIAETERRNPSPAAAKEVESFYSLLWRKGHGISSMPKNLLELPTYMQKDILLDLSWAVFYHSPTFRKTTIVYKRWLSTSVVLTYKQPGERFFSGPHCYSNLYYLKSGIVQLMSADDSISSVLSVTSGTLFGDVSFLVPPRRRRVIARCLTYCEVYVVSRGAILMSLHKFPDDRRAILKSVSARMKHARDLYICKQSERGQDSQDRTEDEGFFWLKNRWWEISVAVQNWKMTSGKGKRKCELSLEEQSYHCVKYIGQLVLCPEMRLRLKSMFVKVEFPWILAQYSSFSKVWNKLMLITVYTALLLYPPHIVLIEVSPTSKWFWDYNFFVDVLYMSDILVCLATTMDLGEKTEHHFLGVVFQRCKKVYFYLDLMSTPVFESILRHFYDTGFWKFNRLIKTYILFYHRDSDLWDKNWNIMRYTYFKIILATFVFYYVPAYVVFFYTMWLDDNLSVEAFFGKLNFGKQQRDVGDKRDSDGIYGIVSNWLLCVLLTIGDSRTQLDVIFGCIVLIFYRILNLYLTHKFIATVYMEYREKVNYQYFVSKLKSHYLRLKIHPDLLKRLDKYLICHWNYFHGMDILHPNLLRDEPYDIYYKLHGALAEKVIGEAQEFLGADTSMIRQLAYRAKFLILPKNSTLVMFGVPVENVTWIVRGVAKAEYHNEKGETMKMIVPNGEMLSMTSVLLGRASLRTYTSVTDVEILYIKVQDFFMTIRRYPDEFSYFKKCKEEIGPLYDDIFVSYVKKHRDYQKKLRERVFHARQSVANLATSEKKSFERLRSKLRIPNYFKEFRKDPEARITLHWLTFRAAAMFITSLARVLHDSISYNVVRGVLCAIVTVAPYLSGLDTLLRFFLPFYNHDGVIVTGLKKCALRHLTGNFIVDATGMFMSSSLSAKLFAFSNMRVTHAVTRASSMINFYLLTGWFNYYADRPSTYSSFLLILKWQVILVLAASYVTFIMILTCAEIRGDHRIFRNSSQCWMPEYHKLEEMVRARGNDTTLTSDEMSILSWEALRITVSALVLRARNQFRYENDEELTIFLHVISFSFFWFQSNYCLAILILYYRGHTVFQHGVNQLKSFLHGERVPNELIKRSEEHFMYWWRRTAGVNMEILMNERIGVVFRQDLNYYFYKKTFKAVDTLLRGGESLERMLASSSSEQFCLPGEDVMREMDLTPNVFIVHRGRIVISRNGEKVATLTKGSIFGQLEGMSMRASRVSARALDRADLLVIPVHQFQEAIGEDVKYIIGQNPQAKLDYMAIKKTVPENPYNSIEYILRGAKTIQIPRIMKRPINAETQPWYARWLLVAWVSGPVSTAALTLLQVTLPLRKRRDVGALQISIFALDLLHLIHLMTDFFSMELEVVDSHCVYVYDRIKKLKRPWIYMDIISLTIPFLAFVFDIPEIQIVRLLRMHAIYTFYHYFCKDFQTTGKALFLKSTCLLLLLHATICGWMAIFCRYYKAGHHHSVEVTLPEKWRHQYMNKEEWIYRRDRRDGCSRLSPEVIVNNTSIAALLTPSHWRNDYLVAASCIVQLITRINLDFTMVRSNLESFYESFLLMLFYSVELWFISIVISSVYTMFREMYHFDYAFHTLIKFLKQNDVSHFLQRSVFTYTRLLWQRQKGNWLPNITQQAPLCLREDILSSLYVHHLRSCSLFASLPDYFLRQLSVRLRRVVIFPGKFIVQEGEVNPIIYFIHEGEVERWYTDKNGEPRMSGVLTINGFYGLIPGLFPNTPYMFSYFSRTVVDIVYLVYGDWQDLLNGYPDLKIEIYSEAVKMKTEMCAKSQSKMSLTSKMKIDPAAVN